MIPDSDHDHRLEYLRNCCKACEKAGLLVFGDLVFNHMQAIGKIMGKLWENDEAWGGTGDSEAHVGGSQN